MPPCAARSQGTGFVDVLGRGLIYLIMFIDVHSQTCVQDPDVAKLFERIAELRSSYVNDQLEASEDPSSDVENAHEVDEPLFVDATPAPAPRSTPPGSAPVTPGPAPPAAMHRTIPSLDSAFSTDSLPPPPSTPRDPAAEFIPPPMSPAQKEEVARLLRRIAVLELSECLCE